MTAPARVSASTVARTQPRDPSAFTWAPGEILRDIARGGLAGLAAGIVLGGIGGRLAMRASALLVPEAAGRVTENGNRIGEITLGGTVALVVFMGLFAGASAAIVWVVVRPWIPGGTRARVILAMPIAVALGTFALVSGVNPDFVILGHDPVILAILVGLIALLGAAVALADGWLDRRLPHPVTARAGSTVVYAGLTAVGVLLTVTIVVPAYLQPGLRPVGIALVVTGLATFGSWVRRVGGHQSPGPWLRAMGRLGLSCAVLVGGFLLVPELAGALGID